MDDAGQPREQVTLGVDTHAELHVAAALDERGRVLGTCTIPTTTAACIQLVRWAGQYGDLAQVGIEGTGSYGAALTRWLRARTVTGIEVDGTLQGTVTDGVVAFRGVPYAKPPLGPLRFAPPVRLERWSGTRSAERFGPAPMQGAAAPLGKLLVGEMDEDCLSLNVWTPAVDDRQRPVLVWFHGGAFVSGAGSSYNGAVLARRGDVVIVTVNYRLGLFSWLRGIDVCGESLLPTGNNGLYDQLAALEWVVTRSRRSAAIHRMSRFSGSRQARSASPRC